MRVSTIRYQSLPATLYAPLGLTQRTVPSPAPPALYDASKRRLLVQRRAAPTRTVLVNELVRALEDQSYNLRRVDTLRTRDHDRWLAARGIVDGTAALASGLRSARPRGSALDRFLQLEASVGTGPGRALAAQLRYLGGKKAVASALRTFPQTTEQLLHVDKFLEREPALPVRLAPTIGASTLISSETFGELDVRNFLQAFGVTDATVVAEGWGGGRLALYTAGGTHVAALVVRWDTPQDALEWQAAVPHYVAAAFAGATAHTCPPLDACWSGPGEVSAGVFETTSVLASGPGSAEIAAALLR
jgi:hypothetical protein